MRTIFLFTLILILLGNDALAAEGLTPADTHAYLPGATRKASDNEPTLMDTLLLYLWMRENNLCALCEPDRDKKKKMVGEALEKMKTQGNAHKKAAERLLSHGIDAATAYRRVKSAAVPGPASPVLGLVGEGGSPVVV